MSKVAFAVAAHPDDIEFMMAGTLLLLGRAAYELHYMTVANGSCGSTTMGRDETIATRTREARDAAAVLGAAYHAPIVDDLRIFYRGELVERLCAIVRGVRPQIILIPAMHDYMEDHMNTSRLMVTAAFCRSMPNFPTNPPTAPIDGDVALYHAMPAALVDQLRNPVRSHLCVDVTPVTDLKRQALACHRSQIAWLEQSQGLDSTVKTMEDFSRAVGRMSRKFTHAEGWQRHAHMGFGPEDFNPLCDALGETAYLLPDEPTDEGTNR